MNKVWAFRRTPYSLDMCCIFPYCTKNEERLYCPHKQNTRDITAVICDSNYNKCSSGWYRCTSHSENRCTEYAMGWYHTRFIVKTAAQSVRYKNKALVLDECLLLCMRKLTITLILSWSDFMVRTRLALGLGSERRLPVWLGARPSHHSVYTASCVKTTLALPTKKLECQEIETNISSAYEN